MYNRRQSTFGRSGQRNSNKKRDFSSRIDISHYKSTGKKTVENIEPIDHEQIPFSSFELSKNLIENLSKKGFMFATPIQSKSIQPILDGKDLIGIANTGTGKTGAFLIPLIEMILKDRNSKVLVVVPNRELAQQINQELMDFTKGMNIFSTCCIGGADISRQINFLRKQNNFIIGTPGRLKDLYDRKCLKLGEFNKVVLDEVDTMLDMGFIHDLTFLIEKLKSPRQSLCFSATMQPPILKIANKLLTDPIEVSVRSEGGKANVNQDYYVYKNLDDKVEKLVELLSTEKHTKKLVFVGTKMMADKLEMILERERIESVALHGDKRQAYRTRSLAAFKNGSVNVLVATDVASRGIDIKDVSYVINFDEAQNLDIHTHRIGRTGRYNSVGNAITFVAENRVSSKSGKERKENGFRRSDNSRRSKKKESRNYNTASLKMTDRFLNNNSKKERNFRNPYSAGRASFNSQQDSYDSSEKYSFKPKANLKPEKQYGTSRSESLSSRRSKSKFQPKSNDFFIKKKSTNSINYNRW